MDKEQLQNYIASRVAKELSDGDIVNLGIGLPTRVANFIPENIEVILQSENGFLGLGPTPTADNYDPSIINAGGQPVTILPGGCFFDSATSFGIIRGGHIDVSVLGALQVDEKGNIANYMIPGKMVPGMGGAMDLVTGAKKVIVAMEHTAKGAHKILKECSLPLTAVNAVDLIITEMGVIKVTAEGLKLIEINPEYTVEDIKAATEASLIIEL
ncbi:3-oxoacid CoA-transferase subunit B [Gilliamella apicola]|jgi:3-oxoacid CoA-transferase, B subunit|uniref:CoA transferase subunit B n=1 Tax=Gilliamella apicola TaxID=1196095 RepID=A0A2V4E6U5_9GAMM|nr:3-oxoacid CoA-transferase subunit B [Gilliamella apicola]KES18126.1 Acyl CoA:acetate/3-ketoacid CoA transferase, beta subunit [Gilliamella apicola SCGC AB-598-I20]PXZ06656.1 CoA transferase subunit B [Gilliamella apicola]PXZ08661.1 CoA transferase subunit B [Gilliamella apicola]